MNILLVDDDSLILNSLSFFLEDILGHHVTASTSAHKALELFKENYYPMVLTDIRMPGMDGVELLQQLKTLPEGKNIDIVLITGHGDMKSAIEALRSGAYDYLSKPVNVEELGAIVNRIAEHQSLLKENIELTHRFEERVAEATHETESNLNLLRSAYAEVIGVGEIGIFSDRMREIVTVAERLHEDRSVPVLIEGETGTGKEIIARLIHYGNGDVTTPFVSINCSAITSSLFESELFGYEGGAFTGARKEGMKGKLEIAQGGTLFLDEIGDLPLDLQPKLLRCLQEHEMYRVGGVKNIKLDVRIICATNRNLEKLVEDDLFRKDLYFRLNMGRIYVPTLREMKETIAPLAQLFLKRYAQEKKRHFKLINKKAIKILEEHTWPGNVRELQNAIERIVLLYDGIEIVPEHLNFLTDKEEYMLSPQKYSLEIGAIELPPDSLNLQELEAEIVRKALKKYNGNKSKTAQYLGLTRSALRSKIKNTF